MSELDHDAEMPQDLTEPLILDSEDDVRGDDSGRLSQLERLMIIPRMEPMTVPKFLLLFFACGIFPALFILAYSALGYGEYLAVWSRPYREYNDLLVGVLLGIATSLYLFDAHQWTSRVGRSVFCICLCCLFVGVAFWAQVNGNAMPHFSYCVFSIYIPFWLRMVKYLFFPKKTANDFVIWLSGPLFTVALLIFVVWIWWTKLDENNSWTAETRIIYSNQAGCMPDFSNYPQCQNPANNGTCFYLKEDGTGRPRVNYNNTDGCDSDCEHIYDKCLHSFALWIWPMLAATSMLFLSFVSSFLRPQHKSIACPATFLKVWIMIFLTMWVSAEIAEASPGLFTAMCNFVFSLVFAVIVLAIGTNTLDKNSEIAWKEISSNYESFLEILKSLVLLFATIPIIFYLTLSFVNQLFRKALACCSRSDTRPQGYFTEVTSNYLNRVRSWNWIKTIRDTIFWGMVYMSVAVAFSKLTNIFLAWVIDITKPLSLALVTFIMLMVGLIMFLMPPIPGIPIYMASGIVLVGRGYEPMGAVGAVFYTLGVVLIMKLIACTLQQKGIGENMSQSTKVRQLVAINSGPIRAANLILSDKKITLAKVTFLTGGPDWPTSVLCGILRLDLLPILLGTLPVMVSITPAVLSGAFLFLQALPETDGTHPYPSAEVYLSASMFSTVIVSMCLLVGCAITVERTMATRQVEIDAIEIDEDVREADLKNEEKIALFYKVNSLSNSSFKTQHFFLGLSLVTMIICVNLNLFAGSWLFEDFKITDTIKKRLNGSVFNICKNPGGWIDVGFLSISIVCVLIFDWLACRAVSSDPSSGDVLEEPSEVEAEAA